MIFRPFRRIGESRETRVAATHPPADLTALLDPRLKETVRLIEAVQSDTALLAATVDAAIRTAEAIRRAAAPILYVATAAAPARRPTSAASSSARRDRPHEHARHGLAAP